VKSERWSTDRVKNAFPAITGVVGVSCDVAATQTQKTNRRDRTYMRSNQLGTSHPVVSVFTSHLSLFTFQLSQSDQ
jgi:hypothetical protein